MELYAVRYGKNFKYANLRTVFENSPNPNEKLEEFPFLFYVAKHEGETILFDTGFRSSRKAEDMGITLLEIGGELSALFGADKPLVDSVIVTHSHFDHIDNLDLYGNIHIVIAKEEYKLAMQNAPCGVRRRLEEEKVILVEKEYLYGNKFLFRVIGGHSPGSSVVYFEDKGVNYVITGDECYSCDNLLKNIPTGICRDKQKNAAFIEDSHKKGYIPLPFHDAAVMRKYKSVSENIVQII